MNVKSRKRYTAEFKVQAVALLESSFLGSGLFSSYLKPYFRARFRKKAILETSEIKVAFRCDACGTTILAGACYMEAPCLHCDGMIPAGRNCCPQCGWSYAPPRHSLHG